MTEPNNVVSNLKNSETWIRLIYMLIFSLLLVLVKTVVWVIAALQFLLVLFTGRDNPHLRDLGQGVAKWTLQATLFLSYNSEEKPFPFADWPEIETMPAPAVTPASSEVAGDTADSQPATKTDDQAAKQESKQEEKKDAKREDKSAVRQDDRQEAEQETDSAEASESKDTAADAATITADKDAADKDQKPA